MRHWAQWPALSPALWGNPAFIRHRHWSHGPRARRTAQKAPPPQARGRVCCWADLEHFQFAFGKSEPYAPALRGKSVIFPLAYGAGGCSRSRRAVPMKIGTALSLVGRKSGQRTGPDLPCKSRPPHKSPRSTGAFLVLPEQQTLTGWRGNCPCPCAGSGTGVARRPAR